MISAVLMNEDQVLQRVDITHNPVEADQLTVCDCGNLIVPTGKAGRPAKVCQECKSAIVARRAAARTKRCLTCKRFLKVTKGRGRPAKTCPTCKAKADAARVERQAPMAETYHELGYCNSECMYASGDVCTCPCQGEFHQAGWMGLGELPDHDHDHETVDA